MVYDFLIILSYLYYLDFCTEYSEESIINTFSPKEMMRNNRLMGVLNRL